jgi:prophage maintenance system killer protein
MGNIDKDKIIRTNAVYGGKLSPSNSIDYAIEQANNEKNFYRKLAYVVRSMTSDHSFIDGNKRTAITMILTEFQEKGIKVDKFMLEKVIVDLARTGEGDINKIERKLRRCSRK